MAQTEHSTPGGQQTKEPELKRVMGPKLLLLFIVGDILGTGVYATMNSRSSFGPITRLSSGSLVC